MMDRPRKCESWYILSAGRVVYVSDFTREEVALLIDSLKDEFSDGQFACVAISKLKADPRRLIRLNRDWNDITPYLGEFDFGIWDFRLPEEWKQLIYINDSAERLARAIKDLREEQNDKGEQPETAFEVYDKNLKQFTFFNPEGAQQWGPVSSPDDPIDPTWLTESRLFRHGSEGWTLIVAKHLCEPVAPKVTPEAERLDSYAAVGWLMSNSFPVPPDVARFGEELLFRPGLPPSKPDENKGDGMATPRWDNERGELSLKTTLCKKFRQPAKNQRKLLDAFEEDGWPSRIDDPLPGDGKVDPKERLRDTVRGLNQKCHGIRFELDGTGEGVIWSESRQSETDDDIRF